MAKPKNVIVYSPFSISSSVTKVIFNYNFNLSLSQLPSFPSSITQIFFGALFNQSFDNGENLSFLNLSPFFWTLFQFFIMCRLNNNGLAYINPGSQIGIFFKFRNNLVYFWYSESVNFWEAPGFYIFLLNLNFLLWA